MQSLNMVGKLMAGRFRIEKLIGKGSMGVVYKAYDTSLNSSVALKVLAPDLIEDPELRCSLHHEAVAIRRIGPHPGIATVYDLREEEGEVFIIEELVEGIPLRKLFEQKPSLTVRQIKSLGIQLAEALAAAHRHGVFHRDLKPENIMVVSDEGDTACVKILDFGLAKLRKPLPPVESRDTQDASWRTSPDDFKGTPVYCAPEQIPGPTRGPVDHRTDIHAFGLILYEMATGTNPFLGPDLGSVFNKIRELVPPAIRKSNS